MLYLIAFSLLWYGYAVYIVPKYDYMGFAWTPNREKVVEGILAVVFFACILPSKVNKPSDFYLHVHFLLPVLPMSVLFGAADLPREYFYMVLFAFVVVCVVRNFQLPKIKGDIIPVPVMLWSLLIISAVYISSIILLGGIRFFNLNLLKVYEFRSIAAQNLPGLYAYLSPMVSKALLPFLLLLAIYRRNVLVAVLAIFGSVMIFGLTNHKAPLFYPFFVLGVYAILSLKRKKIELLLIGYIFCILVSISDLLFSGSEILIGLLFLYRVFFIPSHINYAFYDFFSDHPHTLWSESKITFGLVEYPYDFDSQHLIGYHYFNSELIGANTGWLGSGYMQFGFTGMLIYAVAVGLLISGVDTLAQRRELAISGAIVFIPLFELFLSSDLLTALLTHGLILVLFLAWSCQLPSRIGTKRRKIIPISIKWSSMKAGSL